MDPIYWSVILLGIGFFFVFLELFLPSAGLLGIIAGILLVSGVVVAFFESMQTGAIVLLLTVMALPILLALMVKIWPHTPIGRRIMMGQRTTEDVMPNSEAYTEFKTLVGQLGIAKTKMLPSGIIIINDRKYDAISDGFAIEVGQPIKVSAVRGNHIIVMPYDGEVEDASDLPVRDRDVLSQPIEELGLGEMDIDNLDMDKIE